MLNPGSDKEMAEGYRGRFKERQGKCQRMCGRFTLYVDSKKINSVFHLAENIFDYVPRYNIAPGQDLPVITRGTGGREISYMKWGLVPHWAKDPKIGYRLINARAETVDCKPAFRASFRHNRCLIPADGFYEWMKNNGKQPIYISLAGSSVFAAVNYSKVDDPRLIEKIEVKRS